MIFLGVFSSRKEYEKLKKTLTTYNLENIELINITNKNIDSLKHVKFDSIIITDNLNENLEFEVNKIEIAKTLIDSAKVIMINIDIDTGDILSNREYSIISYGFNGKATITLSSITDDRAIICIQREIKDMEGNIIENKEVEVKTQGMHDKNLYNTMVGATIAMICFGKM